MLDEDYTIVTVDWGTSRIPTAQGLQKIMNYLSSYKYTQWNKEIKNLKKKHPDVRFPDNPRTKSLGFQAVSFILDPLMKDYAFNREHLINIMEVLCPDKKSGDIIQLFNKIDQKGIKRYYFKYQGITYYTSPKIEYSGAYHRNYNLKGEGVYGESGNRAWFKQLSSEPFQKGHKDPDKPLDDSNIVMQPASLNRSYKDKYIFDDRGLPFFPTEKELLSNTSKYVVTNSLAISLVTNLFERFDDGSEEMEYLAQKAFTKLSTVQRNKIIEQLLNE